MLLRASDPIYEAALGLGGHRKEAQFWRKTLTALGRHLGLDEPGRRAVGRVRRLAEAMGEMAQRLVQLGRSQRRPERLGAVAESPEELAEPEVVSRPSA